MRLGFIDELVHERIIQVISNLLTGIAISVLVYIVAPRHKRWTAIISAICVALVFIILPFICHVQPIANIGYSIILTVAFVLGLALGLIINKHEGDE